MLKHLPAVLISILIISASLLPVSALTLSVDGGCVDKQVSVTTDIEAIVIFRMNSGTPIFS